MKSLAFSCSRISLMKLFFHPVIALLFFVVAVKHYGSPALFLKCLNIYVPKCDPSTVYADSFQNFALHYHKTRCSPMDSIAYFRHITDNVCFFCTEIIKIRTYSETLILCF